MNRLNTLTLLLIAFCCQASAAIPGMDIKVCAAMAYTISSHEEAAIELHHLLVRERQQHAYLQIGNGS